MKVNETVVDIQSKKMGRIVESRTSADGYSSGNKYLVNFDGLLAWKEEVEIMRYITNEGFEHGGEFLTEG